MTDTIIVQIYNSTHNGGTTSIEQPIDTLNDSILISNENLYEIKNSRIYIKTPGVYSVYFKIISIPLATSNWSGWIRVQAQYDGSSDIMDVTTRGISGFANYGIYEETTKPCMILSNPTSLIIRWIFTLEMEVNIVFQIARIA